MENFEKTYRWFREKSRRTRRGVLGIVRKISECFAGICGLAAFEIC